MIQAVCHNPTEAHKATSFVATEQTPRRFMPFVVLSASTSGLFFWGRQMETKRCTGCKEIKSLESFRENPKGKAGRQSRCRSCENKRALAYRQAHPEKIKEQKKRWYEKYKSKIVEKARKRYYATQEERQRESREYRRKHRDACRQRSREHSQALRQKVVLAYGGKCACCGESTIEFLVIDHIAGDGAEHRKSIGGSGALYGWLRNNGYPKDNFRLLCHNCNSARGLYGYCPHERQKGGEDGKEKG